MPANPVLRRIKQIGRKRNASPKELKAAIETGIVESGLRNLPGGDADSAGWRQERASLYKDPTNLDASINRFFDETSKAKGKHGTAGELAAAVQRPAAQYRGRYQQQSARAQALMGSSSGSGASARPTAARSAGPTGPPVTSAGSTRSDLLKQYLSTRGRPGSVGALASGLGDLKAPSVAAAPRAFGATAARGAAASSRGGSAKVTGPNPGRIKPQVLKAMRETSARYGKTIVGSDGTGHSRMTSSGNVSQHTTGNATDIPATGKELVRMGQAALEAAGMPRAKARKQKGGLYNVNGRQIIFATNSPSGHMDHLHLSAK